eukprot:TRINITY_DN74276_c0_g1_i1.p2 TRINITY_DN74276_c0_g1~~TRINITY_DN74276_c0_g1_i1.p2  ORF type:complete len:124 (-),score=29.01 TRINITY_DN74276_c0_g1_i1:16-387(-)
MLHGPLLDALEGLGEAVEAAHPKHAAGGPRSLQPDPLLLLRGEAFDAELHRRVRNYQHPTGTLKIGPVVDPSLSLRHDDGVFNIRLGDASVFATSVSGHTDAAAQLAGHLAAERALQAVAAMY